MVFNFLTDGLAKTHLSQFYLHQSEVIKSVSYTETSDNPGAFCA